MSLPYNDTTNLTGLVQLAENNSGLGIGGISGNTPLLKQFTRLMNNAYQKLITIIFEAQDDWDWDDTGTTNGSSPTVSTYPVATTSLVANQRDYTFPLSMNLLKDLRVDISYDGTNWYRAMPLETREITEGVGNDTVTDNNYIQTSPRYELRANSIWIFPRATGNTGSLRLEYLREPVEFAYDNTANTPGLETVWQPMIPLDASIVWANTNNPGIVPGLQGQYADMEQRMKRFYGRKDEDRVYQMDSIHQNMF